MTVDLKAKRIKLALYLEGVRVPVQSAMVSAAINQPASADITIPAVPHAAKLKPRTLVHLFYNDFTEESEDPSVQFKLMFEGELVSWSFAKEESNRAVVLRCSDFTNWIFKIKPWQIMSRNFFDQTNALAQKGQKTEPDSIVGTGEETALPRDLPSILVGRRTKMPGVLHSVLMSGLGAMHWSKNRAAALGLENRFSGFTDLSYTDFILNIYWVKHLNLLNSYFFSGAEYPLGHSLMGMMQALNYMVVSCPVASKGNWNFVKDTSQSNYVVGDFAYQNNLYAKNFFYWPEHIGFTLPPRSNVIFPDQLIRLNISVDFQREITRLIGRWTSDKIIPQSIVNTYYEAVPEELNNLSDNVQGDMHKIRSTSPEIIMDGNDEELLGVWPEVFNTEAFSSAAFADPDTFTSSADAEDYKKSIRRMMHLMFKRLKFATRPVYAISTFHPYLVPGLPCMIADIHFPMLCQITQITHDIREGGECTTHVVGQYGRTIEEQSYKFVRQYSDTMNYAFGPYDVGKDVYPGMLGYDDGMGCIASKTGVLEDGTPSERMVTSVILGLMDKAMTDVSYTDLLENISPFMKKTRSQHANLQDPGYLPVVAMAAVIENYLYALESKDVINFIENFNKRNLVSFADMFSDIGNIIEDEFPKLNVFYLEHSPFISRRREPVQDMADFLSQSDGIIADEKVPNSASILDILSRAIADDELPEV